MKIFLIAAIDNHRGIGEKGQLPWSFSQDMAFFRKKTTDCEKGKKNVVLMGRKTFFSLKKPLVEREHIVITRQNVSYPQTHVYACPHHALEQAKNWDTENIFIIGGEEIFRQTLFRQDICGIFLTHIDAVYPADCFFPPFSASLPPKLLQETQENGVRLQFFYYTGPFHAIVP